MSADLSSFESLKVVPTLGMTPRFRSPAFKPCAPHDLSGILVHSGRSGVAVKISSFVPSMLRFGAFELDSATGELRTKGMKIRLQGAERSLAAETCQRR